MAYSEIKNRIKIFFSKIGIQLAFDQHLKKQIYLDEINIWADQRGHIHPSTAQSGPGHPAAGHS